MASVGAIWGPATLRLLRHAATRASKAMRTHLAGANRTLQGEVQHAPIRAGRTGRQPIHPAALLKQRKRGGRWFSSASASNISQTVRRFMGSEASSAAASRSARSTLPNSNTSRRVAQWSGRAPFASTLRPNLTGGAFPRSAGGYSLGGNGARHFTHTPAAPAQVVQNVSQAMRAFFLSGQKLRYDGLGPRGQKQYRAVSALEDKTMSEIGGLSKTTPGAFIDFQLSPTVTALSPLAAALSSVSGSSASSVVDEAANLNTEGLLDLLSGDFARTLQDLKVVLTDLKRLSALGDLPIALEKKDTLRVRFPGMDAEAVERLCDDIGLQRGVVGQDTDFDVAAGADLALRFPFAPDSNATLTSPGGSARSLGSQEEVEMSSSLEDDSFIRAAFADEMAENPWLSAPEEGSSLSLSPESSEFSGHRSEGVDGLKGIHLFLEECDRAQGRLG